MIAFLLFLILLLLVGRSLFNMTFTVIGAVIGLILVLVIHFVKKHR